MQRAFVFPGQGSQQVGMGRALAEAFPTARAVFEEVDDALSQRLSALMFEGPQERLTLTENAQPALMAVSVAVMRVLQRDGGLDLPARALCVAGHSLGEYSALCAAGALDLADTARLLRLRGSAMQAAVPVGEGAMAALLGLDFETARTVAEDACAAPDGSREVCAAANDNAPGQVVVSGHKGAVQRAVALSAERGGKRGLMLPVSAPFHCPLMAPAAEAMAEALERTTIAPPVLPVVANVSARPEQDPTTIRKLLVEQVTGTVRWRESVLAMKEMGIEELVEAGSGKVLSGLARRIDPALKGVSLGEPTDVEAFLARI